MVDKRVFGPAKYFPTTNPVGVTNPPLAVWKFEDPSHYLEDQTANGRDLSVVTGSFEFQPDEIMGLVGMYFDTGQDHELIAPLQEALVIAQDELGTGDASLTVEAIVRPIQSSGAIADLSAGGESLATNYLWTFGTASGGNYYSFLEYGAGANASVATNAPEQFDTLMYLAMTISADGLTFKYYRDGVLLGTGTATHRAEKNSAGGNAQRIRIGRRDDDTNDFKGLLCGIRVTDETFDDADIADAWDSIAGYSILVPALESVASFEEQIEFPPPGGPALQSDPLPGSSGRGRVTEVVSASFGEAVEFQSSVGPEGHGPLSLGPGIELKGDKAIVAGFEEDIVIEQGGVPEFNTTSLDSDGHNHFIGTYPLVYRAFFYDATDDPWNNPTANSFTGYARNGRHYTNGIEDIGPVYAPWYSEVSSADRSTRGDFPIRSLIVIAQSEVCIFDLDTFTGAVDSLRLWMRFRYGNSSNFYMIGRGDYTLRDVKMKNGLMVLGQRQTTWEIGRLIMVDFKGDDTYNTGQLIGSDNHWRWNGTIVQRNEAHYTTTGVSPSLRQNNEYVYSVSIWVDDDGVTWVAFGGEDDLGVIRIPVGGVPDWAIDATGVDLGEVNLYDEYYRNVMFDRLGILWFTVDNKLFRNINAYKHGVIIADLEANKDVDAIHKGVELSGSINALAEAQNYIFASCLGDFPGLYAVQRGSLETHLAYSKPGGGGIGTQKVAGAGEIYSDVGRLQGKGLRSFSLESTNLLSICTRLPSGEGDAECTIIRTTDDYAPAVFKYPVLNDSYPIFHELII